MWIWDACAKQSTNDSIINIFITLFSYRDAIVSVFHRRFRLNSFAFYGLWIRRAASLCVMNTIRKYMLIYDMAWGQQTIHKRDEKNQIPPTCWIQMVQLNIEQYESDENEIMAFDGDPCIGSVTIPYFIISSLIPQCHDDIETWILK